MPIKSSKILVSEALKEIKTISPSDALKLSNDKYDVKKNDFNLPLIHMYLIPK